MVFLVIAPGTVGVYVPWKICKWEFAPPLLGILTVPGAGALLIVAGLAGLLDSLSPVRGAI